MKDTLIKERGEGREFKRKREETLSKFERLQKAYQDLEREKEALKLSTIIMDGEKKDCKNKISELEVQKYATNRQAEELGA